MGRGSALLRAPFGPAHREPKPQRDGHQPELAEAGHEEGKNERQRGAGGNAPASAASAGDGHRVHAITDYWRARRQLDQTNVEQGGCQQDEVVQDRRHPLAHVEGHVSGRKGHEHDRCKHGDVWHHEPWRPVARQTERAVVAGPEGGDHEEADEEGDEARRQVDESDQLVTIGRGAGEMGRLDLDDQQRDGDGEHRVGEEDQPLQRVRRRAVVLIAHSAVASILTSSWPSLTWAPAVALSSATMPSNGAVSACSIFIASRVRRRWPLTTLSPAATSTAVTFPGMGASISPSWVPCDVPVPREH